MEELENVKHEFNNKVTLPMTEKISLIENNIFKIEHRIE